MTPVILLDCDGILSDFVSPALDLIHQHTGDRHTVDEITQWNVFEALDKKDHEHILDHAVKHNEFCSTMPVMPGALDAVTALRLLGEVFIVTSPYHAPSWVFERTNWLKQHLDFDKKQIVNTAAKHLVAGDVLVDDSDKNLREWRAHMAKLGIDGLALLWDRPWNQNVDMAGICRVSSWEQAIGFIKEHLEKRVPDDGHPHLINGDFQSDKYPTTPRNKVPLSVKDKTAQDLLWTYAQRRRSVDAEFATDLELALRRNGYEPKLA